ncbi:MAG: hypothetical protein C4516_04410 [Oxalobacter sp.]|nr:MAG: hypothetical protein C4516_04410 [Oxalobacter sp.]
MIDRSCEASALHTKQPAKADTCDVRMAFKPVELVCAEISGIRSDMAALNMDARQKVGMFWRSLCRTKNSGGGGATGWDGISTARAPAESGAEKSGVAVALDSVRLISAQRSGIRSAMIN